jgi:DNA-binding NarL/FixJ family response regulator
VTIPATAIHEWTYKGSSPPIHPRLRIQVSLSRQRSTERERDVLAPIARGLSSPEIAQLRHVRADITTTHIRHLLAKLNARARAQLVTIAYRCGSAATPGPPALTGGHGRSDSDLAAQRVAV